MDFHNNNSYLYIYGVYNGGQRMTKTMAFVGVYVCSYFLVPFMHVDGCIHILSVYVCMSDGKDTHNCNHLKIVFFEK